MFGSNYDPLRTRALAGIAECAILVDTLANEGTRPELQSRIEFCLKMFLQQDHDQTLQLMQNTPELFAGLKLIANSFVGQPDPAAQRQVSYMAQIIQVMRQFSAQPEMLGRVADRIGPIQAISADSGPRIEAIGQLYEQTISTLSLRIQVRGSQGYLRQEAVATQIRAILFFGIRFALLWQQKGGHRADFLLRRRNIATVASEIMRTQTH